MRNRCSAQIKAIAVFSFNKIIVLLGMNLKDIMTAPAELNQKWMDEREKFDNSQTLKDKPCSFDEFCEKLKKSTKIADSVGGYGGC